MNISPLTDGQLYAIRTALIGDYLGYGWTQEYMESVDSRAAYYRVSTKDGTVVASMPDWAAGVALFLPEAHDALPALLAEVVKTRALLAAISAKVDMLPLFEDESKASDYELGRHDLAESIRNMISRPKPTTTEPTGASA